MAVTHMQDIKSSILILISDSIQLIITGCTNWGTSGMSDQENTACSKTPSLCSRNRIQEQNADAPSTWPTYQTFTASRTQDDQRNTICTHQVQEVNIYIYIFTVGANLQQNKCHMNFTHSAWQWNLLKVCSILFFITNASTASHF